MGTVEDFSGGRLSNCRMLILCVLLVTQPHTAPAAVDITLDVGSVEGHGWSADGVEVRVQPGKEPGAIAASLHVDRLMLPEPAGELRDVTLRCDAAVITPSVYRCERGRMSARQSPLDAQSFTVSAEYRRADGRLILRSPDLPWQGMRLRITAELAGPGWTVTAEGSGLEAAILQAAVSGLNRSVPPLEIAAGTASFRLRATGDDSATSRLDGMLSVQDLSLSNASGSLATEGLAFRLEGRAGIAAPGELIDYSATLTADAGEVYLEPAYFDISTSPLAIESAGSFDVAGSSARIDSFRLEHADVLSAGGEATLARTEEGLRVYDAAVEIDQAIFPGLYTTYLQGFLTGTPLAKLETRGRIGGRLALDGGRVSAVELRLVDVHADDAEERLAVYGASGNIAWSSATAVAPLDSALSWDGGFVYRVGFGAGSAVFSSTPDGVTLEGGLRLPLLDGAVVVETLEAQGLSGGEPEVGFDARLEPVSLAGITTALGWPALPGKLSGELPLLSVSEGAVTLGGSLIARVFDGTARISELRIEQPFGANRRTSADVMLDDLDLALVTDVFTFGRITGRLDGAVRGLEMLQGRPIAFDARLFTPADDDSVHRISRRALSNISEIAGSGTAALSAGFLGLFEEFRYDSLGIRCVLEGDVCHMSGVKPARQGYYLVKGSGLPRIDVIGHSREVNWPRLVAQITEALRSREVSTAPQSEERR